MPKATQKAIFKLLAWGVVLVVAYLFVRVLMRDWGNVQQTIWTISWLSWLSVPLFVLAVAVSGLLWGRLVDMLTGQPVAPRDAVRIHAASWVLKYIPGQVGSLVNKIAWGATHGYSKKAITTSVLYENVLMVFASMLISVWLVVEFGADKFGDATILLSLLAVLPLLIVFNQHWFYRLLNTALRLARRNPIDKSATLTTPQIALSTLAYTVPRLINGVGFVVIAQAFLPVTPDMYAGLVAMYVFAGAIGMLALMVPSGIGVREAVIVIFASVYFTPEQAVLLALIARFYATLADLGVAGVYLVLNKGRIRQS